MMNEQASYVVLIDVDNLIVKPCFPLFPEWGEQLFVASMGDKSKLWRTVDYLLSMRESTDIHLSVWLLSKNGRSLDEVLNDTEYQHLPYVHAVLRHIDTLRKSYADVDVQSISYRYQSEIENFDTANQADIQLITRFEYPLLQNDELLSQQWLLPMGLRALFHQAQLLNRHLSGIRRIELVGHEAQLLTLIEKNRQTLATFSDRLNDKQKKLQENIGKLPIQSLNTKQIVHPPLGIDELSDIPYFHCTYAGSDEQNLRNWIRQIDSYPKVLKDYNKSCHEVYLETARTLFDSNWLLENTASAQLNSPAAITHQTILNALNQETERLHSECKNIHFDISPNDNVQQFTAIEQEKNDKRDTLEKRLMNSCRKRPTPASLWTLLLVPLLMMIGVLFIGEGKASFTDTMPYPTIFRFSAGLSGVWLAIVAVKVWWSNRQFKRDCAWAKSQLLHFHQRVVMDANSINYLIHNLLANIVVQHNQDSITHDLAQYQKSCDKINYHLAQISTHTAQYGNIKIEEEVQASNNTVLPEIDITKPIEQQPAYFWCDDEAHPDIYEGNSPIDPEYALKEYARYPCIKKITFFPK